MTAVQITQPPLKSPAAEQSQKQEEPKPTYGFRETFGSCPCGRLRGEGCKNTAGALVMPDHEETTSGYPCPAQTHSEEPQLTEVLPSALSLSSFPPHTPSLTTVIQGDSEQGLQGTG